MVDHFQQWVLLLFVTLLVRTCGQDAARSHQDGITGQVNNNNIDHPIADSSAPIQLGGDAWIATSDDENVINPPLTILALIPGDPITDLQCVRIIDDPCCELNLMEKKKVMSGTVIGPINAISLCLLPLTI